jgi:transposase
MTHPVVGIDIAKQKFDVALLRAAKFKTKVFANTPTGFAQLRQWLAKFDIPSCHVCLEATGTYGEALAGFLVEAGFRVSVVNPAQIKAFGQSQLSRTKTDTADAKLIAQFCLTMQPSAWQPAPRPVRELQAYVRRLEALQDIERQELNRRATAHESVIPSIDLVLATVQQEIQTIRRKIRDHIDRHPDLRDKSKLLDSIPGVGEATIAQILAFLGDIRRFDHAKQAAAFTGLNPKQHQSGTSVRGKTRLSKTGSARLRKALYMPAVVAMRYNPLLKAFAQRLKQAGKPTMVIIDAVMRKLLHIIYGVLKHNKPFDPNHGVARSA